jgi:hypothetical protein
VALAIVNYILQAEAGGAHASLYSSGGTDEPPPFEDCNSIFLTVCGLSNPKNDELVKSVWEKAAGDGGYIGPDAAGHNETVRGFFYCLIRSADKYEMKDVVKKAKEFDGIPSLYRAKQNGKLNERVIEKDECMKLAYGEKRHSEIAELLAKMCPS